MKELPQGWQAVTLDEVAERVDYGFTASATREHCGPQFLRITDIQDGRVDWSTVPYCRVTGPMEDLFLQNGDILFARTGATTGKSFLIDTCPQGAVFASYLIRVRPGKMTWPGFLRHYFSTPEYWRQISSNAVGSAQIGVNATRLKQIRFPLPPLPEQRRIAAILDKADAVVRKRKAVATVLTSFMDSTFNGMFGDICRNTHNWPVVTLEEAGRIQLGRQRAPQYQSGQWTRPYLRVANVYEDRIDLSNLLQMDFDPADQAIYRLAPGDILLNEGQSTELVGRPAMWQGELGECYFQNSLIRFRADLERVLPEFALDVFLRYLRDGMFARQSGKTSSVAHLGAGRFSRMPFPMVPMPLQEKWRTIRRKVVAARISQEVALKDVESMRASLLDRAFQGHL